ncbi:MAG: STAS domain-containing protein [Desulfarculaceae bacterium]|jgi:anti-anti-sigma factor
MHITVEETGGVCLVIPQGRLDSVSAPEFDQVLDQNLAQNQRAFLVDFTQLEYISSAGLRSLLMLAKKLKPMQGKLALCGLSALIEEVFEVSGFKQLFSICADRSQALELLG